MSSKRTHTTTRRSEIAGAALETIRAHGLRGLSMERVALRVGLVPSAIYRHFKNKGQVLEAVIELLHERLRALLSELKALDAPPLDRLQELLRRHLQLLHEFQIIPRILFSDEVIIGSPARKAKVHAIFTEYLEHVSSVLREGQAEGSIRRDMDVQTMAVMFLGLFQSTALMFFASDGGFDVARHVDRAWRAFREGILPPAEVPEGL